MPIPRGHRLRTPRMEHSKATESNGAARPRVSALVALTLLEVIQAHDRPFEVFEEEDTSVTIPRRLGLSDVVERRVRNYQTETRRGRKISDQEFGDLIRLVIKRPDARAIFMECGVRLAGKSTRNPKWTPRRLAVRIARRRVRRRLQALFGRRIGGFGDGAFTLEGRSLLFMQSDPGGAACALVSGMCSATLSRVLPDAPSIDHTSCEARGDTLCRWSTREGME